MADRQLITDWAAAITVVVDALRAGPRPIHMHPRKRIVEWALRPNDDPRSRALFPQSGTATLECGHRVDIGAFDGRASRSKRMACVACGTPAPDKTL